MAVLEVGAGRDTRSAFNQPSASLYAMYGQHFQIGWSFYPGRNRGARTWWLQHNKTTATDTNPAYMMPLPMPAFLRRGNTSASIAPAIKGSQQRAYNLWPTRIAFRPRT